MKHIDKRTLLHRNISNKRRQKTLKHIANRKKHLKYQNQFTHVTNIEFLELRENRKKAVYAKKKYNGAKREIVINNDFGLETKEGFDYFVDKATEFIDFNDSQLWLNLKDCNRVWPSGVTLLCSLFQWSILKSIPRNRPRIASSKSNNDSVNSYLSHCGFYDYVKRLKDIENNEYKNSEIVKIRHENSRKNIEVRENDIVDLLNKYSTLNTNEIEYFNCVVLSEVFNNVTEHGVPIIDAGWWILAQYHPKHKIISLCIADNGIGFRHSLMSGPQRAEIKAKIDDVQENDGLFIKLAVEEVVSGAINATTKKGFIVKRYERGARRGNGLKRINKTCCKLKIGFTILSHNGYLNIDQSGTLKYGSKDNKVFAGTLYHFLIPAK